eukprot:CAMPEP_0119040408 /NCGR_PEP_ID=MMETSP1177-20130426/10331_1 /TAXON_ID=2985 /ORGANISM="Ochromonas sp, Strain CCMP1899" /LENGTH=193 /DNA_ID=CAMNT_0007005433 /DNA_START=195 /DNA_END=776 /DNA_ORIENTATION=-
MNIRKFSRITTRFSSTENDPVPVPAIVEELTELSRLEIRVGKIIEIAKHPEADSLYVEKVDCGEAEGPRTIVSGLVQFCTVEQLLNKNVIVLCNLKPRPLKGILSAGMLLCATSKDETQVETLDPPEGALPGQLIKFAGHKSDPAEAGNRASKAYGKVADEFFVNDDGIATFKGIPFMTPLGAVKSNLKGKIS